MGIEFNNNRVSSAFVGRFDRENSEDMEEFEIVRKAIKYFNKTTEFAIDKYGNTYKWRLEKKGREPYKRFGTRKFTYHGDLVGGIENAKVFDVYIQRRYKCR